jgi:hypothetical protein
MKSADGRKPYLRVDFFLVFAFTAILIWPLFKAKYLDKWASIESTFIADARFLKEHWPHPLWQPLWYGGTRFDYIYPPALRYGTAALAKLYPMTEARAYHIYVAFFYCLGIAGVYLLVRVMCESRGSAWLAAAASALLSPAFLFMPLWRIDSWPYPARLGVLVRYGEGPHMTALALLPFALTASFIAMRSWRPGATAAAVVCCALVVSNNFYGAVALAVCYPTLLWSVWNADGDKRIWLRALAIPALAYGLTAFWLTPSYLRVTTDNLKLVSEAGNTWSIWVALAVAGVYLFLTAKWARGKPELLYTVFVAGFALFFVLNVLGNQYIGFLLAGGPTRLTPEMDLAMILAAVEWLRRLWIRGRPATRALALAVVLMSLATALPYVGAAWALIVPDTRYQDRVEYKLTGWMAKNLPGERALATGTIRFWYDAWHDLPQLGGGSEQGVDNQLVASAYWLITNGSAAGAVDWMRAFGVDAILVPDKTSHEHYHDFPHPESFAGVLPVLLDDHEGNVIYRVPRRFPDLARVVETGRVRAIRPIPRDGDPASLRAYVEALENGPDTRAATAWDGASMLIQADLAAGQSVVAQVAYDPQWRAESGGAALPISRDALGQMLIEAPPGRRDIRLLFETPLENRVGQIVSLFAALVALVLFVPTLSRMKDK